MKTPGSRKWSARRIRSPSTAPWVNGLEGSIDSTPTSASSSSRSVLVSAPIRVLLPTPGGPVRPMIRARPVFGKSSATRASPSGSRFSTMLIARANARPSPASTRSASDRSAFSVASATPRRSVRAHPGGARADYRPPRDPLDALLRRERHAQAALRPPALALCVAALSHSGGLALGDRRACLLRPQPPDPDLQARQRALRALHVDRRRDEDPLPRGRGRDRPEDRPRPGLHDLRLPPRANRRAVRHRRPG